MNEDTFAHRQGCGPDAVYSHTNASRDLSQIMLLNLVHQKHKSSRSPGNSG